MTIFMNYINQQLPILQFMLLLATLVGGVFLARNTKKSGIVQIQGDTILAMQQQIDALKIQNAQQQEKINQQEFKLQVIQEALKDEGILITVDGERVTIKDTRNPGTTIHRPGRKTGQQKTTLTTSVVKKTEEGS